MRRNPHYAHLSPDRLREAVAALPVVGAMTAPSIAVPGECQPAKGQRLF
jgi:hypothetical protein